MPETPPPGAEPLDPVPAPRVLLAGGGTAGHVNPLLATAAALRDPALGGREGAGILVLGTAEGLEAGLVPETGFDMAVVPRVPMPRRPTGDLFMLPRRLSRAVGAAGEAIEAVDAQVVGGFGGYATLDFFARVLKKFASESERSYPHIIMDNDFSMPSRTRALLTGEGYADVVAAIASSMRFLVSRGGTSVRYIVLPCGTSHYFLPDVYRLVPEAEERVVHAIRLLGRELKAKGVENVLVIAAEGALKKHLYRDCLHEYDIAVSEPCAVEYQEIRRFIEYVKADAYPVDGQEFWPSFRHNLACSGGLRAAPYGESCA